LWIQQTSRSQRL